MKIEFGKPDSKNESFMILNIKSLLLIIPAILIGHYLDEFVKKIKLSLKKSILFQTFLNILVIFILHLINNSYAKEFQTTLAGLFFSALFFAMQTNYIKNLKTILGSNK